MTMMCGGPDEVGLALAAEVVGCATRRSAPVVAAPRRLAARR
jgi:hypothetical protein